MLSATFALLVSLFYYELQMSRSTSTFSLNDSAKSSAVVQRSNSLDHPPIRARVPVCMRPPCSLASKLARSPGPALPPESSQNPNPNVCPTTQETMYVHGASLLTQPAQPYLSVTMSQQSTSSACRTSTSVPAVQKPTQLNPKSSQPKSSQYIYTPLPSVEFQPKSLAPQPLFAKERSFSESCRDPRVPLDASKAVLTSPRRETLL